MDCSRPASRDPETWVENCPDFARPICEVLRDHFLNWEPDLTEAVKWNMLCYTGRKLVFGMSGCKRHVGLAFFRGMELEDSSGLFSESEGSISMRSIRVTALESLDFQALRGLIRRAANLDSHGPPPLPPRKREPAALPDFFATALCHDKRAAAGFQRLPPSSQREYIVWLISAKRAETRNRRLSEAIAALRHGKKWLQRKS